MAVVGVLTRVDVSRREDAVRGLSALPGVEVFELDDPRSLAVVITSADEQAGCDMLVQGLSRVAGVVAAWPVYLNLEDQPTLSGAKEFDDAADPA